MGRPSVRCVRGGRCKELESPSHPDRVCHTIPTLQTFANDRFEITRFTAFVARPSLNGPKSDARILGRPFYITHVMLGKVSRPTGLPRDPVPLGAQVQHVVSQLLSVDIELTFEPRIQHPKRSSRDPPSNDLNIYAIGTPRVKLEDINEDIHEKLHPTADNLLRPGQTSDRKNEGAMLVILSHPLTHASTERVPPIRIWPLCLKRHAKAMHPLQQQRTHELSHAVEVNIKRTPTHTGGSRNARRRERLGAFDG